MVTQEPREQLLGRQRESEVLERLLEAARGGSGGVLVVHGEPGVGKTALLEYALEAARGFRVARAVGVEGEMELAYAALQQLSSASLDFLERLPDPQRDALAVAFGLTAGRAPNPFLVGLAVLARRLLAEKIALVFGARQLNDALAGLPELHVGPLGHRDARALLDSALPGRLDEQVLDRIVVETRGNPLALLELPRGLPPAQLAGGFGLPAAVSLPGRIEDSFRRQLEG